MEELTEQQQQTERDGVALNRRIAWQQFTDNETLEQLCAEATTAVGCFDTRVVTTIEISGGFIEYDHNRERAEYYTTQSDQNGYRLACVDLHGEQVEQLRRTVLSDGDPLREGEPDARRNLYGTLDEVALAKGFTIEQLGGAAMLRSGEEVTR